MKLKKTRSQKSVSHFWESLNLILWKYRMIFKCKYYLRSWFLPNWWLKMTLMKVQSNYGKDSLNKLKYESSFRIYTVTFDKWGGNFILLKLNFLKTPFPTVRLFCCAFLLLWNDITLQYCIAYSVISYKTFV